MVKGYLFLQLLFVACVQGQDYWNNLRCRKCENAESFDRCNEYKICLDNEACYMDQIIEGNRIIYNGGCRAKNVCVAASGKKRKRDSEIEKRETVVSCSRCCDGQDYCNDHLCGIRPSSSTINFCNSCDGKDGRPHPPQYPEDCSYIRACEPQQTCFSSMIMRDQSTLSHYTTCEDLSVCQHLTGFILQSYKQSDVGKRDAGTICAVCCGDQFCNKYACETTKKRLKYLDSQNLLNHTTLKEIPFFG